jgi:hypothetical protein
MTDLLNFAKKEQSKRIADLNDALRRTFAGGRVMLTAGIDALAPNFKSEVLKAVREFSQFDKCNDPYGEHDFGAFELANLTVFWKVDYYGPDMDGGSEDPSDPTKTTRVLTIMRADEY